MIAGSILSSFADLWKILQLTTITEIALGGHSSFFFYGKGKGKDEKKNIKHLASHYVQPT